MQNVSTRTRRRRPKQKRIQEGDAAPAYVSKAVARALDVLDCFSDRHVTLSLKEISGLVPMPESSLFRILVTLETRGYLEQNPDGSYQLSPKVLFGRLHERAERLRQLARPHLQKLATRFDETASLAYLFLDKIQVLDTVESLQTIRFTNTPGRVLPPHCSSLGKAIAAFQPLEKIERILEVYGLFRRTEKSVIDRRALLAEFEEIRRLGYAWDREESVPGGICFGAPVRAGEAPVVASVSISVPAVRLTPEREAEMIEAVRQTGREIAEALESAGA
ncbi:MAG: IclR family transcriptional regulator [Bryobacteraceae bacterium]